MSRVAPQMQVNRSAVAGRFALRSVSCRTKPSMLTGGCDPMKTFEWSCQHQGGRGRGRPSSYAFDRRSRLVHVAVEGSSSIIVLGSGPTYALSGSQWTRSALTMTSSSPRQCALSVSFFLASATATSPQWARLHCSPMIPSLPSAPFDE